MLLEHMEKAEKLAELADSYLDVDVFKVGGIVRWKAGMRNTRLPNHGEPMVVLEVKGGKLNPNNDAGTPYHDEDASVRAAFIDDEERFLGFWLDAHRLTHC